jgi:hypothetical protein
MVPVLGANRTSPSSPRSLLMSLSARLPISSSLSSAAAFSRSGGRGFESGRSGEQNPLDIGVRGC